ncbi:MAG: MarR family transcriptional regulator [Chloroflexi bacterium]|nr:MarR family transcriptional regulator [Chloroflexota bacterium]MCL5611314.1 MarR family transcriptional regulator [Chloroflexota bacterium]
MPDNKDLFQVESPEESPGFLLWQVSSLWQRQINAGLRRFDLTHAQFVLLASLAWLVSDNKPITQVELASHAKMDVMMASNVLRTLEDKGLILRNPHPTDTRAKSLAITDKGRALAGEVVRVVENIDREFFSKLGAGASNFNRQLLALVSANINNPTS